MLITLQILDNILLLGFLGLSYFFIERSRDKLGNTGANVLNGFCFGMIALLVTATPVQLADGATVDARAGPVILAGIVAGPAGALLAAVLGGLSRGFAGGSFAFSGMAVYFVYALTGLALRQLRIVRPGTVSRPVSIAVLAFAACFGAAAMYFLIRPADPAAQWARQGLIFILAANTLSVAFVAAIIGIAGYFLKKTKEVFDLNERLNLAKRAGGFGIWDYDIQTGKLKWDHRSMELHGVTPEEFTGVYEDWASHVHPDDLEKASATFAAALEGGHAYEFEYRAVLPDGGHRTIKGDAVVLRDAADKAVRLVGTNLDLTELRAAEAKLIEAQSIAAQAQKFETVGQLTGGVAHDFNNLLSVIMGNQELLKDQLQTSPVDVQEANQLIDASIEATRRGAELTRNMLAYARKARLMPEETDLNDVVLDTEKWLRRTIKSSIDIQADLQGGLWRTLVDKASLQSALVNLLVNARDAFDGAGRVTVKTANVEVGRNETDDLIKGLPLGRYAMLCVSDDGAGIPPGVIDKIFDPFFTTKPVGQGSGLGLSMVQGFVEQSGGAIRVRSEPGKGTCFRIYFPAIEAAAGARTGNGATAPFAADGARGGKRVLLVEDQGGVLAVMEKTLTAQGFEVVTAESGDAAFRIFNEDPDFDLIATDIVMPGTLQGPSLARQIRALNPKIPFVFMSGYAEEMTQYGNGIGPDDIRLMKPVSRKVLLEAVQQVLSEPGTA